MYRGRIVETGPTEEVCTNPRHPYTRALLSAVPRLDPRLRGTRVRERYREAARVGPGRSRPGASDGRRLAQPDQPAGRAVVAVVLAANLDREAPDRALEPHDHSGGRSRIVPQPALFVEQPPVPAGDESERELAVGAHLAETPIGLLVARPEPPTPLSNEFIRASREVMRSCSAPTPRPDGRARSSGPATGGDRGRAHEPLTGRR